MFYNNERINAKCNARGQQAEENDLIPFEFNKSRESKSFNYGDICVMLKV